MLLKGVLAFPRTHHSQRVFLAALATLNTSSPLHFHKGTATALPKAGVQHLTWHKSTALDARASPGEPPARAWEERKTFLRALWRSTAGSLKPTIMKKKGKKKRKRGE